MTYKRVPQFFQLFAVYYFERYVYVKNLGLLPVDTLPFLSEPPEFLAKKTVDEDIPWCQLITVVANSFDHNQLIQKPQP